MNIDKEFKSIMPPLTEAERNELETSILREGCRDPLVIWEGTLIDGHHRYEICKQHNIPFETVDMQFESRTDVKIWIIENQSARRNLFPYQRIELALKLEKAFTAQAKEKEHFRKTTFQKSEKSNLESTNTSKKIAKIAGVSHDTIAKVKKSTPLLTRNRRKSFGMGR